MKVVFIVYWKTRKVSTKNALLSIKSEKLQYTFKIDNESLSGSGSEKNRFFDFFPTSNYDKLVTVLSK
jgi:hypothetical protein